MIQLRVRTEYSFGQTFAPLGRVLAYLKEQGCTAAGMVDNNTWGHVEWEKRCAEYGIQPLLGAEVVVTDDEDYTPKMWFLARSTAGLSELYRNMTISYQQPVTTKRGTVPRLHRSDIEAMTPEILKFAGSVLDADWLEKIEAILDVNPSSAIETVRKMRMKGRVVETSDNAYARPEDREVFEVVAKAGTKPTPQHLLDTLRYQDVAAAIADSCKELRLPVAPMIHVEGNLEALCREGIERRGMGETFATDLRYEKRMVYELDIIKQKDYDSYFLVVADMVAYAKRHMLVGPSRGSAAGSLVCFLAGITEIDPLPPGLFFERFIDISRKDLPDIDLDFPDDKRHLVFTYMAEKYGPRNVAHIGTINTFAPRSALIQVCKAMGIPPLATAGVKAAMIERSSADARAMSCLSDTLTQTEPGRKFIEAYPHAAIAGMIEGHSKHTGVHAAGLLVCNDEITNYCTVDNHGIAQIDMGGSIALGLLKIDVLGLTTLSVLEQSGILIDWYRLPLDDPATYTVFNEGRMCGIFQFEGDAMRSIATQMKIEKIGDVDAVTALARPGPFAGGVTFKYLRRKRGEEPIDIIHPLVAPYMAESFQLPIYQEQTLAICREIGNFGWKEAAMIRKAMSKSLGVEFFNQYWEMFREGAASHGVEEKDARRIWEMIMTMGSWQMNKAHTYSYAVVSYWTAYLKAHHRLEFAASTLRNTGSDESAAELLREMVKEGVPYVAWDPDLSEVNWSVKDKKLVGGFIALKGIGPAKAETLVALRNQGKLTAEKRAELATLPNPFADLWPIRRKYGHIYDKPFLGKGGFVQPAELARRLKEEIAPDRIATIDGLLLGKDADGDKICHCGHRYFIGELINKNPHSVNEEAYLKKKAMTEPYEDDGLGLEYLDVRLRDDTGTIGGRVDRKIYREIGLQITEKVPLGSDLLVWAQFFHRDKKFLPYAFIKKWKRLDG